MSAITSAIAALTSTVSSSVDADDEKYSATNMMQHHIHVLILAHQQSKKDAIKAAQRIALLEKQLAQCKKQLAEAHEKLRVASAHPSPSSRSRQPQEKGDFANAKQLFAAAAQNQSEATSSASAVSHSQSASAMRHATPAAASSSYYDSTFRITTGGTGHRRRVITTSTSVNDDNSPPASPVPCISQTSATVVQHQRQSHHRIILSLTLPRILCIHRILAAIPISLRHITPCTPC